MQPIVMTYTECSVLSEILVRGWRDALHARRMFGDGYSQRFRGASFADLRRMLPWIPRVLGPVTV
jgi:hypothetical protein